MGRICSVCSHPERYDIERVLVNRSQPYRDIARQYSVSKDAVQRHKEHIPELLVKSREAEEVAQADDLLAQVRDLQSRAYGILDKAEGAGDLRTALGAIREARGNLELVAKLLGELDERPVINLAISSEWLEIRAVIVQALEPHPGARESVLRALEEVGDGRA